MIFLGWRVVTVKQGDSIRLQLSNLVVEKNNDVFRIPLDDINMLILEGNTTLTTNVLSALTDNKIVVVVCDKKYMPRTMILDYGGYHHCAKRARDQLSWATTLQLEVWREIVSQKITNQIKYAVLENAPTDRIEKMIKLADTMELGDKNNREGMVAKVYFNTLYGMEFTRDNEDYLINAAMNYGYAVLRAAVARAVVAQGLLPVCGIFHKNEYNAFNLVDDLMEPFRPLMDCWLNRNVLVNQEYLTYEIRLKIISFLTQPILSFGKVSDVNKVIDKFVISFVSAMNNKDVGLLDVIDLQDFVEVMKWGMHN